MKQNTEQLKKEFDEKFPIKHYYCEDPWYSCPLAPEGCADDSVGDGCNCGAIIGHEKLWGFFLPHLISSDEIKREAVKGFISYMLVRYGLVIDYEKADEYLTQSKEGGENGN